MVLDEAELHLDAGEKLAELIMDLAGDLGALLLAEVPGFVRRKLAEAFAADRTAAIRRSSDSRHPPNARRNTKNNSSPVVTTKFNPLKVWKKTRVRIAVAHHAVKQRVRTDDPDAREQHIDDGDARFRHA